VLKEGLKSPSLSPFEKTEFQANFFISCLLASLTGKKIGVGEAHLPPIPFFFPICLPSI